MPPPMSTSVANALMGNDRIYHLPPCVTADCVVMVCSAPYHSTYHSMYRGLLWHILLDKKTRMQLVQEETRNCAHIII